jgi:hypothetical protein
VDPGQSQFVPAGHQDSEDEIVHSRGTGSYGGGEVAGKEGGQ